MICLNRTRVTWLKHVAGTALCVQAALLVASGLVRCWISCQGYKGSFCELQRSSRRGKLLT